ncbi:MAG: hypothetical protein EA352_05070 [Gemmatimonadales bacterium]|nr:MAG: hypothetical protein EA352_05070 [Gemmatimonadales bacterium]
MDEFSFPRAKQVPTTARWWGRGIRPWIALVVVLSMVGCATKADIRDLREDMEELNRQQSQLLEEILRQQTVLADSVVAVGTAQRQSRGEVMRRLAEMQDDLLRTQELMGLSQQQLASLRDEWEQSRAQITQGPRPGPGTDFQDDGTEASELYDDAMTQFQRGSFTAALFGFEEIVDRFPDHALAPAARFYKGEIHEQQESFEEALEAFLSVAEFHPDSDEVPDALYRAAILHLELGDAGEARTLLERVVNTWPDADVADLAREELGRIP